MATRKEYVGDFIFHIENGCVVSIDADEERGYSELFKNLDITLSDFAPMVEFVEAGITFEVKECSRYGACMELYPEDKLTEIKLLQGSQIGFLQLATKGKLVELIDEYTSLPF